VSKINDFNKLKVRVEKTGKSEIKYTSPPTLSQGEEEFGSFSLGEGGG